MFFSPETGAPNRKQVHRSCRPSFTELRAAWSFVRLVPATAFNRNPALASSVSDNVAFPAFCEMVRRCSAGAFGMFISLALVASA